MTAIIKIRRMIVCGSIIWEDGAMIRAGIEEMIAGQITSDVTAGMVADQLTVVHGGARGADMMADRIARSMGLNVEPHPADWQTFGKSAGIIRNSEMANAGADMVIGFKDHFNWKMNTGGTENMFSQAIARKVPCKLYTHDDDSDRMELF